MKKVYVWIRKCNLDYDIMVFNFVVVVFFLNFVECEDFKGVLLK